MPHLSRNINKDHDRISNHLKRWKPPVKKRSLESSLCGKWPFIGHYPVHKSGHVCCVCWRMLALCKEAFSPNLLQVGPPALGTGSLVGVSDFLTQRYGLLSFLFNPNLPTVNLHPPLFVTMKRFFTEDLTKCLTYTSLTFFALITCME